MSIGLATRGYYGRTGGIVTSGEPYLANPYPADGSTLALDRQTARHTTVSFDVVNYTTKFSIWIKWVNDDHGFLVYDSTVGFLPPFDSPHSYWNGTGRMTVYQHGGWQDDIECFSLGGQADPTKIPVRYGGPGSQKPPHAP